jgi:hypothetical protein
MLANDPHKKSSVTDLARLPFYRFMPSNFKWAQALTWAALLKNQEARFTVYF